MGFARFVCVSSLVISWLSVAAVGVAAQQLLSGAVVDGPPKPHRGEGGSRTKEHASG